MGLKTLFTQAFPQKLKDYYDEKIINVFNPGNVASGATSTSTVMVGKSGVASFSQPVASYPSATQYTIYNNNISPTSVVEIFVYCDTDDSFVSINGIYRTVGAVIVNLNDGGIGNSSTPTIAYRILA